MLPNLYFFQPKLVVDAATLTGAMAVAIGGAAAGVYSTRFHELPSKIRATNTSAYYLAISIRVFIWNPHPRSYGRNNFLATLWKNVTNFVWSRQLK